MLHYNLILVLSGLVLLSISTTLVGLLIFLDKKSLVSEALGHAALPGLALGFWLSGAEKDIYFLLLGVICTNFLAFFFVYFLERFTALTSETLIALTLSVFYGVGIFCFSYLQNHTLVEQTGLDRYLLGRPAAMGMQDVQILLVISFLVVLILVWKLNTFKLVFFDRDFATHRGFSVFGYRFLMSILLILVVAVGIQIVGAIFIASLLILSTLAARQCSFDLVKMIFWSLFFNLISVFLGLFLSLQNAALPTGALVIFILSSLVFGVFFFTPSKGIIAKILRAYRHKRKIISENFLKTLYELKQDLNYAAVGFESIQKKRFFTLQQFNKIKPRLIRKGLIIIENNQIRLTEKGFKKAEKINRAHLLWEKYLEKKMQLPQDHTHNMAEIIEHLMDRDLEKMIQKDLNET